jgi:hypothetical protein
MIPIKINMVVNIVFIILAPMPVVTIVVLAVMAITAVIHDLERPMGAPRADACQNQRDKLLYNVLSGLR